MRSVRVERTLDAPIEAVFDVLADHARYDRFGSIRRSELIRQGSPDPNGVGALRRVVVGPLSFDEEITAFERPTRLDYLIVKLNVPFRHRGGSVRLTEAGPGRTAAVWTSEFSVPLTGGGPIGERVWGLMLTRGFNRTLGDAERLASSSAA